MPITFGVPQGSVLGPLFFRIYINDLNYALIDDNVKLYADDAVLCHSGDNAKEAEQKLQLSLNKLSLWCRRNKLTVNINKTKLMVFGSRSKVKRANNVKLFMSSNPIQKVPSFKYLGLTLDPTLTYSNHIATTTRLILHKMSLLSKMKRYLNNDVALDIYKAMLLPYFDYADVIFDMARSLDLDKIQRLQNRCLRICLGQNRLYSTDRVHKEAAVPFLKDRRKAHILNFMYTRQTRRDLLNIREIRTRAHDAPLFEVKVPRCEAFKRSIGYFGSTEWNNLPPASRNIDSYLAFIYHRKNEMLLPLTLIDV